MHQALPANHPARAEVTTSPNLKMKKGGPKSPFFFIITVTFFCKLIHDPIAGDLHVNNVSVFLHFLALIPEVKKAIVLW
jgi:hypothetical protein